LQSGGAENRLAAITLQRSNTLFGVALQAIQQLCFGLPVRCDACHFILNGTVRNSALAGRGGPSCTQNWRGPPTPPPWGGVKKPPPPPPRPPRRATPAVTPETAKSPRERVPHI
jgi:hypothetical protein